MAYLKAGISVANFPVLFIYNKIKGPINNLIEQQAKNIVAGQDNCVAYWKFITQLAPVWKIGSKD